MILTIVDVTQDKDGGPIRVSLMSGSGQVVHGLIADRLEVVEAARQLPPER